MIAVEPSTGTRHDQVIDTRGNALIPGLHDHHIHLLATAAGMQSVDLEGLLRHRLEERLRHRHSELEPGQWLRAIGHHESDHGPLDRTTFDAIVASRPVRVQHASGAMWVLNSGALRALPPDPPGAERGDDGMPNGRLHRADEWLRQHLPEPTSPDLGALEARLASRAVTGVNDMTPFAPLDSFDLLATACRSDALSQQVMVSGPQT